MTSRYPIQIDSSLTLPTVTDNFTSVTGSVVNKLREAIINVQSELGVKPSGISGTVRSRLDQHETIINEFFTADNAFVTGSINSGPIYALSLNTPLIILDGKSVFNGIDPANVSGSNQGVIYYDLSENKFKVSENGGAYADLLGGTSGGGNPLTDETFSWTPPTVNANEVDEAINVRVQTSDATVTTACSFTQVDETVADYVATVLARSEDGQHFAADLRCTYESTGGSFTELRAPSVNETLAVNPASWAANFDRSGSSIRVRVTGQSGLNVRWSVQAARQVVNITSVVPVFDPTTITGLRLWYDAADLTQGGGVVSAIADKSGNAILPTINSGEEPTYTSSNPNYNNRPTWKCVAGGGTKVIQIPTSHGITTTARTIVMVGQCGNANYALGTPNGLSVIAGGGGSGNKWQASSDAATFLPSGGGLADNPSVAIFVINGASSKIYINSLTPTTGDTGSVEDWTGQVIYLGNYGAPSGSLAQNGDTTHFLIYDGALSQSDCEYLLNGFGSESGITIT